MTAVDRALRHIAAYIATRRQRPVSAKATRPATQGMGRRTECAPHAAQDFRPPRVDFDLTPFYEALPEVFGFVEATPVRADAQAMSPFEWSITASRTRAMAPMTDEEARDFGILPDGEVAVDW